MRTPLASACRSAALGLFAAGLIGISAPALATTYTVTCGTVAFGVCATQNISPAGASTLSQLLESAVDGDIINVGPGTYKAGATSLNGSADYFQIEHNIKLVGTSGAGSTFLIGATANAPYAVRFCRVSGGNSNGATLDGFTLTGAWGGVEVQDFNHGLSPPAIDNITIRNVVVNPTNMTGTNTSHSISFINVTNSLVESSTVVNAYNNGIFVQSGSGNYIVNNLVQGTVAQHAIALKSTTGAVVAGNAVTGTGQDGIIALGTTNSRFERNTISGNANDGIVLTDDPTNGNANSPNNFVGFNKVTSTVWAGGVKTTSTGLWFNGAANGNFAFGNDLSGAPENGIAVFGASASLIEANRVHNNFQGGILVWNYTVLSNGQGGQPTNTFIKSNFVYNNPTNAMVNLRDVVNTDIGFNYLSGLNYAGDAANPGFAPGGGSYAPNTSGVANAGFPSSNTTVYANSVLGMMQSIYFDTGAANANLYRNRFFGTMNQYSLTPATVNWDNGSLMGGNYWSGFAANGNPSTGATPFTNIYCPGPNGCPYQDHYPFAAETLGHAYSVSVSLPRTSSAVAAASRKTVKWDSKGCVYTDIDLLDGAGNLNASLASNYPDVGYFVWNVAPAQAGGSYSVRVTCKNSGGVSVGVAGATGLFTVAPAGLTLLSPGSYANLATATTTRVTWARGAGVTGAVSVFCSVNGAAETTLASGITTNSAIVTLPAATNSNKVAIRIATGSNQDSTDGYFSITNTSGQGLTTVVAGQTFIHGQKLALEWKSFTLSRYVDILVGGTLIAQNLPDFGHYDWLVTPAFAGAGRTVVINYKNSALAQIATFTSGTFTIATTGADLSVSQSASVNPGSTGKDVMYTSLVSNDGPSTATGVTLTNVLPAGMTYIWSSAICSLAASTVTCNFGSLAPGTATQVQIVLRPASVASYTNTVTVSGSTADPSSTNNASSTTITVSASPAAAAVARYRLYNDGTKEHLYTTDFNEYTVLGGGGWVQEGPVGKVLNNPGSFNSVTATPYYRLYNDQTFWHHWTTDANEYYTLIQYGNWHGEGVDGYILPTGPVGSMQLYRLNYPALPGLHHWTVDANEYNTLITPAYGWIGEGGSGFVIQ